MKKLILVFLPIMLFAQNEKTAKKEFIKIHPKFSVQTGFCIPEFYNLGYEVNASYYPYAKKWFRVGPAFQLNNFYVVEKEWFTTNNDQSEKMSELGINMLVNTEFIPFRRSSFYVGFAPYIGYRMLNNRGYVKNETVALDISWNYFSHFYDFGTRFKVGGFFGKKQQYGMEAALQMSNRGIADKNPGTKFFNIGLPDYKSYVSLAFVYRIK